ncbi:hypothetical protein EV368DRAFT_89866 [Lentinula lateritia]|nr:hypothetical protein EV368DRAFT_89866 [Lentinula lateritia]
MTTSHTRGHPPSSPVPGNLPSRAEYNSYYAILLGSGPPQGSHLSVLSTTRSFPSSVAVPVAPFELQPALSTLQLPATKEQIAREYLTSKAAIIGTNTLLTKEDIYDAMLRATRLPKKELDVTLKTVEHGIMLLRDIDEKQNQHQPLGEIKGAVESSLAKLDIEKQLQHQLTQVRNEFNERLDSIAANINGTEEKIDSIAKNTCNKAKEY